MGLMQTGYEEDDAPQKMCKMADTAWHNGYGGY
jgi:hypothetical protein